MAAPAAVRPPHEFIRAVTIKIEPGQRLGFDLAHGTPPGELPGQYIVAVDPQSPAWANRILPGDCITHIDALDVTEFKHEQVVQLIQRKLPELTFTISSSALLHARRASKLLKIRDGRVYSRKFYISADGTRVFWKSRAGKSAPFYRVGDIKDVKIGRNTHSFKFAYERASEQQREVLGGEAETGCFSLIVGETYEAVDLVAPRHEVYACWTLALQFLTGRHKQMLADMSFSDQASSEREHWMKEIFEQGDVNHDGQLTLSEVRELMKKMNFHIEPKLLKRKFYEADMDASGEGHRKLDFKEFCQFYRSLAARPDLATAAAKYFAGSIDRSKPIMANVIDTGDDLHGSPEELQSFLIYSQGMSKEEASLEYCAELIRQVEPIPKQREAEQMSIDGFRQMLLTPEYGYIMDPTKEQEVYQDMSQPLAHYFVASSHNTYLSEDQLRGPSEVQAYVRALIRGCRCVELDCWDGDDAEPIIYHGYTLTSKILFKDVIQAIKEYAFTASNYPVILSLENHCSVPVQKKMAHYLKSILGNLLYTDFDASLQALPSPESLKNKILIKGKKLPPSASGDEAEITDDEDEAAEELEEALQGQPKAVRKALSHNVEQLKELDVQAPGQPKPKKKAKLAKELSDLVTYVKSVHFHGFKRDPATEPFYEMSSFGESKAKSYSTGKHAAAFTHRNKYQLARTYPAGTRVNSSNYCPQEMWNAGCQIVALNYQTPDLHMALNQGLFRDNGGSGYILKPKQLRDPTDKFNPMNPTTLSLDDAVVFTLEIISGQHLPKPYKLEEGEIIDPYVCVDIKGLECDTASSKTSTIDNNGFNPVWNETMEFDVKCPSMANVVFTVRDADVLEDDYIAQYSLPLSAVRQGYRHIPLRTMNGEPLINAFLFVRIKIAPLNAGRSIQRKQSSQPVMRHRLDTTAGVQQTIRIPALDRAFARAPISIVHEQRDTLLYNVEQFKESLGLTYDAPWEQAVNKLAQLIERHNGTVELTEERVVNHKIYSLSTTGLTPEVMRQEDVSRPFKLYANICSATETVYQSEKKIGDLLNEALKALETAEGSLDAVVAEVGIPDDRREATQQALAEHLFKLRDAIRYHKAGIKLGDTVMRTIVERFGNPPPGHPSIVKVQSATSIDA